ncbi:MAG: hypothetical protein PHI59_03820 [Candidatus Omnitrophica bacterium]|nr:hypothetical protein [Candidatus Omnitrophota bacterium]
MRKLKSILFVLLAAFLTVFLYSTEAAAVFSVDLNFYSVDFGSLNMGDMKDDVPGMGIRVMCRTDQGNPWQLKIRADRPLSHMENPASFIPNTNFFWYGVSSNVPGNNSLDRNQEDFTMERTVYSAPAGEGVTGTEITMKFKVIVPKPAQSGIYTTKIIFTFTE